MFFKKMVVHERKNKLVQWLPIIFRSRLPIFGRGNRFKLVEVTDFLLPLTVEVTEATDLSEEAAD